MNQLVINLVCVGIIILTSFCLFYYIYSLILIDAKSRGIKHPKLWSLIASSGQQGEGLILYLFKRRKTSTALSKEDNEKIQNFKLKIYCFMAIDLLVFVVFIISIIRFN